MFQAIGSLGERGKVKRPYRKVGKFVTFKLFLLLISFQKVEGTFANTAKRKGLFTFHFFTLHFIIPDIPSS